MTAHAGTGHPDSTPRTDAETTAFKRVRGMFPATIDEVDEACMTRSATDASRYLYSVGKIASKSRCDIAISRLIAGHSRTPQPAFPSSGDGGTHADMSRQAAIAGCRALLKRQLQTGAHWINDPAQMKSAMIEAGLVR